ncbi:phosphopantetheine-binding protein [Prauserella cavernicola]|uniref:Isochorismatase n=1 Tax=Prauserella cavernicola TaxID=2800127 RepID=A0A934QNH0_9PSEU|nr:phosphopantetheine-binding protein [Prauserella cavernicola]MBK1783167.1 isochorismatase [Prauserella cavernicola]
MGAREQLSLDRIRADVLEILQADVDEVADDDDLIDHGLDSIRVMHLVERWRAEGAHVSFVQLAEQPTIQGWHGLLGT